jgi:hypothetical protein
MPALALTIWSWITWFWEKGLSAFMTAWKTSKQATEIAIVAFVAFIALMYFGFVQRPDVTPELTKEVTAISKKLDALQGSMDKVATKADISALGVEISGLGKPARRFSTVKTGSISNPKD